MSRIRTVKPELFKHEDLFDAEQNSKLPLRLAFIGLFTVADCEGRFKWRPRTLKLDVLPHDFIDFAAVLNALERTGFLERYEVDGEAYGLIPSFTRHQIFQTKEQTRGSQFPPPPSYATPSTIRDDTGTVPELSRNGEGTCRESQEGKGMEEEEEGEGKGMEEEAAQAPRASSPAPKAIKAPKPVKATIPADWTPAEATYALLEKSGIERPFAEGCLDEFRLYWTEQQEQRPGWESTFVNNVKRQWERQPTATHTPRNGPIRPIAKHDRLVEHNKQAMDAWLTGHHTHVIEGECHEIH